MPYLLSHYINAYKVYNDVVLHSTLSRKSVRIAAEHFAKGINNLPDELKKEIKKNCMIVSDEVDEKKVAMAFLDRNKDNALRLVILTTEECNFDCIYCYQKGLFKVKNWARENTIKKLKYWIYIYLTTFANITQIEVCFFGGEPLLNFDAIEKICSACKKIALDVKKDLYVQVVTNGSLYDHNQIMFLKDNNLSSIEITIDGPPDIHNIRRPYKGKKGSYNDVLKTLKELTSLPEFQDIAIILRVNVDSSNIDTIGQWLYQLSDILPGNRVEVVLSPVLDSVVYSNNHLEFDKLCLTQKISRLYIDAKEMGYIVNIEIGHRCTFENEHQFVITPLGSLYKCNAATGLDDFNIGTINDPLENIRDRVLFHKNEKKLTMKRAVCQGCKYLPYCRGGCKYQSYVKSISNDKFKCSYKQYDLLIPLKLTIDGIIMRDEEYNQISVVNGELSW